MYKYLWLLNALILSVVSIEQRIGAKGHLTCRGIRQPGIFIQLYDEDSFPFLDPDDLMGSANTDAFGTFCIKGTTYEFSTIEPYMMVEHNCGYEGTNQKAKLVQYLSPHFISKGNRSFYIEHLGEIELLTHDAPVQKYERRNLVYKHVHRIHQDRINECIPFYATYKDFFEKNVFPTSSADKAHDLRDGAPLNSKVTQMPTIQEKISQVSAQLDKDLLAMENSELLLEKIRDQEKHLMEELHDEETNFHHLQVKEKQNFSQEKSGGYEDSLPKPLRPGHREEVISYHKPDVQLEDYMTVTPAEEPKSPHVEKMEQLDEVIMSSLNDEYDPCAFRKKRYPHVPFRKNDPCYKHLRKHQF